MKARRVALVCAAACAIYVVALIATVPAAWIARTLERASAHKLSKTAGGPGEDLAPRA